MPKNQKLQLHQFEINKDNILDKTLYVYNWPKKLLEYHRGNMKGYSYKYPIRNLSEIMLMTLDDIIYIRNRINPNKEVIGKEFWIFSLDMINLDIANSLTLDWFDINGINNNLKFGELLIDEPIKINSKELFSELYKKDIYEIIPQLYNYELCKERIKIPSINRSLSFYPVINEMVAISEPFEYEVNKDLVERYSYAITLRLVNNCEYPNKLFLNIYTGTKIWNCKSLLNKDETYITGQNAHSFYFYKENEYIKNDQKKLIKLMYKRDNETGFKYKTYSDEIVAEHYKLKLEHALEDPNNYNSFCALNKDGIYLITNDGDAIAVKYGPGLGERLDVFKFIQNRFPELTKRELIPSVISRGEDINKKKKSLGKLGLYDYYKDELNFIEENEDNYFYENPPLFISKYGKVFIEIYTKNQELVDAFIELSTPILSLNLQVDKYTYRSCDGFEVTFIPKDDYIARELSNDEVKDIRKRREEIVKELNENKYDGGHILSLIDIYPFHKMEPSKDPKNIIRNTFREYGRVTQFINGFNSEENMMELSNAIYDLLSAAGFLDYNYKAYGFDEKILLGLSPVENSKGKIVILSKIYRGEIEYKIYDIWDKSWLSIEEMLMKLEKNRINKIMRERIDRNRFNNWVIDQLNSLEDKYTKCYFYFDASLRNRHWAFARNGHLDIDKLRILNKDRFKFIRVNTTEEIPGYNILKNDADTEGINKKKGLFSNDNRVFYSIGQRPENIQVANNATKTSTPNKMIGKQRVVEYVVLAADEEERVEIAKESHRLRKLNLNYVAATKYPLPIDLNQRFGEYIKAMMNCNISSY